MESSDGFVNLKIGLISNQYFQDQFTLLPTVCLLTNVLKSFFYNFSDCSIEFTITTLLKYA